MSARRYEINGHLFAYDGFHEPDCFARRALGVTLEEHKRWQAVNRAKYTDR